LRRCAIALVHHPVVDAQQAIVTTAVTNLDVHDLARSARTYGCSDYFVVHPIAAQRELVTRICDHWTAGPGGRRIPDRADALGLVRIVDSLEAVYAAFGGRDAVETWATAARNLGPTLPFGEARTRLAADEGKPVVVVFGTGWGLAPAVVDGADALLEPIVALRGLYNHLSVRAACAIALDRLLGKR
jgi:hypothetical protein